jgi:hypothetical protein
MSGVLPEPGEEVLLTRTAGIQFSGRRRVRVNAVRQALIDGFCYLDVCDLASGCDFPDLYCRVAGLTVYRRRPRPAT